MVWLNIIGITILFLIACSVFIEICEKYNLLVSFRMRKKKEFKEWNRQRNNRTRELKKKIKDWNNQRNQRLRDWKKRQVIHKKVWAFLQKLNFLKIIYGLIALAIGFVLFTLFSALLSQLLTKQFNAPNPFNLPKLEVVDSSFALAFLGTITGIVALFGGYLAIRRSDEDKIQNKIAQKQADTAEQGLITDRINKAVESLGKLDRKNKPVLEVRIGALYALERIAQDSIDDHIRIMKIICAYVRVNRPFINKSHTTTVVSSDIRAALHIIGHRDKWTEDKRHIEKEKEEKYRLDLRHCDLHNIELYDADLSDALFSKATLRAAILVRVKFNNASFLQTHISKADFQESDMTNATTPKAFAHIGDFSNCLTFTQPQINKMFLGKDVKLPKDVKLQKDLIHPQKGTKYYKVYTTYDDFINAYYEWIKETKK